MDSAGLIKVLTDNGFTPTPYSGRGMAGQYCVSVKNVSMWSVASKVGGVDGVEIPLSEQLGKSIVIYWPNNEWVNKAFLPPTTEATLIHLKQEIMAIDAEMDDRANDGKNAVPPTGDDYNELFTEVTRALIELGIMTREERDGYV